MTESDRKKIITKIQKELNEQKTLSSKYKKLNKLKEDPSVVKYLQLLEEISRIENNTKKYKNIIDGSINDSLKERISHWFRICNFSCEHKVWIYNGSFYKYTNYKNETDYLRKNSENLSDQIYDFNYNKYTCLECRKEIKSLKTDWEKFENTNLVLKNENNIEIEYYQDLYYQLLYHNYDFDKAQQTVVNAFNKNIKIKILTKK